MRPSEAEALPVPPGAVVDHLDVADPYGENLGVYRRAARTVLKGTRRLYVRDALRRVDRGRAGSHAAGVFNRAAKDLEKEVFELAVDEIGLTVYPRSTLGQVSQAIASHAKTVGNQSLIDITDAVAEINEQWIQVKHKDDPPVGELVAALRGVQRCFSLLGGTA
jgi:hypothetical protein